MTIDPPPEKPGRLIVLTFSSLTGRPFEAHSFVSDGSHVALWLHGDKPTKVGRGPDNELIVSAEGFSRRHIALRPIDGGIAVELINPLSRLRVDGELCDKASFELGSEIVMGDVGVRRHEGGHLALKVWPEVKGQWPVVADEHPEGTMLKVVPEGAWNSRKLRARLALALEVDESQVIIGKRRAGYQSPNYLDVLLRRVMRDEHNR